MNELAQFCRNIKHDFQPKIKDAKQPVHSWSEKDVLQNQIVDAFVIILRTRGCSWALTSGCTMCGYFNDSLWKNVSDEDLLYQFETVMKNYKEEKIVKIFTSGSFLDDHEVTPKVRTILLERLAETAEKISIESRPEYITNNTLSTTLNNVHEKIYEIGIGLETANDWVREHLINKGFTFATYKKAAEKIKKYHGELKTYVLIKPPCITEKDGIDDSIYTVNQIRKYTDTVSFNPTNVQRHTLVEYLWKRNQYRPPWLWSIVEILKTSKQTMKQGRMKCDIAGGGSIRGAHNCGICDQSVLKAIASFSLSQDPQVFKGLDCKCKEKWLDQLDLELMGFGSLVDLSRGYA